MGSRCTWAKTRGISGRAAALCTPAKRSAVFLLFLLFWNGRGPMHMAPQDARLRWFRPSGCSWKQSRHFACPSGRPEGKARARAPSSRIAAGFCISARPKRAPPLTAGPARGHAVPRGGTYTLHAARRPPGRSGASTCRAGYRPWGGKRSRGPAPIQLRPPRPGSRTLFPAAPARTSEEVERCLGAAVLADASSLPVSCFLGHPSGWGPGPGLQALRVSAGSLGGDRGEPLTTHHPDIPVHARLASRGHPHVLFVLLGGREAPGVAGCGGGTLPPAEAA